MNSHPFRSQVLVTWTIVRIVARHSKEQHRHRVNVPGRSSIYLLQWRVQDFSDDGGGANPWD